MSTELPPCPSSNFTGVTCAHPLGHGHLVVSGHDDVWEHWNDDIPREVDAVQFDGDNYDAIRFWISGDPRDIKDICWENGHLTIEFDSPHKRSLSLIVGDWLCRARDGYHMWTGGAAPASHSQRAILITEVTATHELSSPCLTGGHHAVTVTAGHGEQLVLVMPAHMRITSTPPPAPRLGDGA